MMMTEISQTTSSRKTMVQKGSLKKSEKKNNGRLLQCWFTFFRNVPEYEMFCVLSVSSRQQE